LSGTTRSGVFRMAKHLYKCIAPSKHNVYVIGQANIGKSTLSRALAKCFFDHTFYTDRCGPRTAT
jgi:GTP-binding protein EngB required for normal cell division